MRSRSGVTLPGTHSFSGSAALLFSLQYYTLAAYRFSEFESRSGPLESLASTGNEPIMQLDDHRADCAHPAPAVARKNFALSALDVELQNVDR